MTPAQGGSSPGSSPSPQNAPQSDTNPTEETVIVHKTSAVGPSITGQIPNIRSIWANRPIQNAVVNLFNPPATNWVGLVADWAEQFKNQSSDQPAKLVELQLGADYMHRGLRKQVTVIGIHPHDGAYVIVEVYDEEADESKLFGCEASDLEAGVIDPMLVKVNRDKHGKSRHAENRALRRALGYACAIPGTYTDDGEFFSQAFGHCIDFMRDTPAQILDAIHEINLKRAPDPSDQSLLPRIGSEVLFHLGSSDSWQPFTVTSYFVWKNLDNKPGFRVFVTGIDAQGHKNSRALTEIRDLHNKPLVTGL